MPSSDHETYKLQPGEWWACQEPERITDDYTVFADDCPRCNLAIQAVLHTEGDFILVHVDDDGQPEFNQWASRYLRGLNA